MYKYKNLNNNLNKMDTPVNIFEKIRYKKLLNLF